MTQTAELTREEILEELKQLELRKFELQQMLPRTVKAFYHYRCRPEQHVWIYAASPDQARERLFSRMDASYGKGGWSITTQGVEVVEDVAQVAANTPDNFLRCLSEAEALEFLADWEANKKGREPNSRGKDIPKPQHEKDIERYQLRIRQKERS